MNRKIIILILISLFFCCKNEKKQFNEELSEELERMVRVDQIVANVKKGKYKKLSDSEWKIFKDSVLENHEEKLIKYFNEYGFLGFDIVGEKGSQNFWLMVQHCDKNINFQKNVLSKMKKEVINNNANPQNYAFLIDRIKINSNQPQVYGTQVEYNWNTCQAYPKRLKDSLNVNKRRNDIGLEKLEEYLNEMSELHFEINKETFSKIGITKPKLYKTK